jgi:hypothetical protein
MEGYNMVTVLATDISGVGMPIACLFVKNDSAPTLCRALQWVTDKLALEGITLRPERCFADDANHEHQAILAVWQGCQVRVGIWHILQRSLTEKVKALVGARAAYTMELLVWSAAKGGTGECDNGRNAVAQLPQALYELLGSPALTATNEHYSSVLIRDTLVQLAADEYGFAPPSAPPSAVDLATRMAGFAQSAEEKLERHARNACLLSGGKVAAVAAAVAATKKIAPTLSRPESKRLEAYKLIMDRLFGVGAYVIGYGKSILDRVAYIFPPYSKFDRHDMQLCNNGLESWHNFVKHNSCLKKDRGSKLRRPPLWFVVDLVVAAMVNCTLKWVARLDASAQHRELFLLRQEHLTAAFVFGHFSRRLGLSPDLHNAVWAQFAGLDTAGVTTERTATLIPSLASDKPTIRRYSVQRTVPVDGHVGGLVEVDTSLPQLCFRCTCSIFNARILCSHIFTVARMVGQAHASAGREQFDAKAAQLICTIGRTRWLGECADAQSSTALCPTQHCAKCKQQEKACDRRMNSSAGAVYAVSVQLSAHSIRLTYHFKFALSLICL